MELAGILLVTCILVLSPPSASAESGQLVLRHYYNYTGINFSYIELTCLHEDPESRQKSFPEGPDFQLNGTHIEKELNVTYIARFSSVTFILTPEKEGFFTCSHNGSLSNNSIGLAAQPSSDYTGLSRSHEVELPDADSEVPTELQCDIQPGALRQRYSVQWREILNDSYIIANEGRFNLTLNVSSSLNGSQYQCEVTIDPDGSYIRSYDGVSTTIVTTTASAESGQLVLRHGYPDTNFSYIELTCLYEDPESRSLAVGADFQLNGTDIVEELNVTDTGDGTIRFILTPEKEDFFTCSVNGSLSNNSIGLAAQPRYDYSGQSRSHEVELPDADSEVPTELQCDIQPGALRQRYSVQWKQILKIYDSYIIANEGMFNLTLNISSSLNGSQYQCEVTIDHDGSYIRSYDGVLTTIVTRNGVTVPPTESPPLSPGSIVAVVIAVLIVITVVLSTASSSIFWLYIKHKWHCFRPQDCEQRNDFKLESKFQYSADPYNTADHIPEWLEPVATLTDCTSDGRSYYDEHNDFRLEIPEGAIPEGERVTIDIGVALYGPFQYPKGLKPASPVFWVCVRDQTNFNFMKPVKVTLPHCLNLENTEDMESLEMTFLKGDHDIDRERNYKLKKYNDSLHKENVSYTFEPGKKCGVLYTYHFCMLCNDKKFYENAQFCITSFIPRSLKFGDMFHILFFITFLLNTCRETVRKHITDGKFPEIGKNHRRVVKNFQFAKRDSQCEDLCIVLPTSQALPRGWNLGGEFNTPINVRDIDFFVHDERIEELKQKQDAGLYPPLFRVTVSSSESAEEGTAQIRFEGATEELKIDISFVLPPSSAAANIQSPTSSFASNISQLRLSSVSSATSLSNPPDLRDLLSEVADHIPTRWERLGTELRLEYSQLQTFKCDDPLDSFSKVFDAWQRQCNAPHTLPYTWESMIDVLRRVKEHTLANALLEKLH